MDNHRLTTKNKMIVTNISSRISRNSETFVSEFLENIEEFHAL